jgi:glycine hydroxymethyltransferase
MHIIAAKAVALKEALTAEFRTYQAQIVANARALAARLNEKGFRIVSGGTDNHVFLLDVAKAGITGKVAEKSLEAAGITVNKNTIPYDPNPPLVASGVRIGTPALTTRGMREPEMSQVGDFITEVLRAPEDAGVHESVKGRIRDLCERFPLYDPLM